MKWDEAEARKEMESAPARFPHIDAVYAHNDPGAHGAYLAAQAADRQQGMIFVGIDALPHEGLAYVKQGILSATFQYPTGGAEAIDTAFRKRRASPPAKRSSPQREEKVLTEPSIPQISGGTDASALLDFVACLEPGRAPAGLGR